MFETLSNIIKTFIRFIPHLIIVRATEAGIKFVRGKKVVKLVPGLWWYWPITTEVDIYPIVRQIIDLPPRLIMTNDCQSVLVSGVVVYSISDIKAFIVDNYEAEASIKEVSSAAVRDIIVTTNLEDVQQSDTEEIDSRITEQVKESLIEFGIEVEYFRLTDFCKIRPLTLVSLKAPNE